ncbi:MAG: ABC transporter ATP-binding protein [Persicimonas sp.]
MQIQATDLSKSFGKAEGRVRVLRDVSLSIRPGDFISIVGTSGSGKTTLLNILGGLDTTYDGQVLLGDERLEELSDRQVSEIRNREFGFVFQQFNLLDHLSARENVELPSFFGPQRPNGSSGDGASAEQRASFLLHEVGLADKLDALPPQLSGGQKQRVAIARALFQKPSVIFCDEPTGSLDRQTGLEIMKLFQELNRDRGVTLVVVTHEEHIAKMASRIVRLEDGRVVADQPNEPSAPEQIDPIGLDAEAAGVSIDPLDSGESP